MKLNASTLRDSLHDFPDLDNTPEDAYGQALEGKSHPTFVAFLTTEVGNVVGAAFNGYSTVFVNNLFSAALFAFACHYLWGLPLAQVVDVNLAFFLFTTGVLILFYAFFLAQSLASGEWYGALFWLVLAVLSALLPFAAILGFGLYGWLLSENWAADASVYQSYVGVFADGHQWVYGRAGDVLGLMTVDTNASGIDVPKVNTDLLVQWAQITAAAVAIFEFVLKRMARAA